MCENNSYTAYKKQKGMVTDLTGRPWTRNNEHSYSFQMGDKAIPSQMFLMRKLINY
jgi:hypothetical protein